MKKILKIVLPGGPGGGKTSAKPFLAKRFVERGYYPLFVPEAASILLEGGVTFRDGTLSPREFQGQIMDLICALEAQFEFAAHALAHPKPVIVCDRGLMDGRAYVTEELFWETAHVRNFDVYTMRDARYHAVFHLRTAALGAEEFYVQTSTRPESPEEARVLDEATLHSWVGHPHLYVVDNSAKSIEGKLELLWRHICHFLDEALPPTNVP